MIRILSQTRTEQNDSIQLFCREFICKTKSYSSSQTVAHDVNFCIWVLFLDVIKILLARFSDWAKWSNISSFISFRFTKVRVVNGSDQIPFFRQFLSKFRYQQWMTIQRMIWNQDSLWSLIWLPKIAFDFDSIAVKPFLSMFCSFLERIRTNLFGCNCHGDSF